MDHLYGSWRWFDRAGLSSSLAGSVLFKALLDVLVPVQSWAVATCEYRDPRVAYYWGRGRYDRVVAPALTPLVNPSRAPCDRSGGPIGGKP